MFERIRLWNRARRYAWRTERNEVALARQVISPGDVVLDIGAHRAAFSYWMAKAAGPAGRVLAFEPIPFLAKYLRQVAAFLPARLEVMETALSNSSGMATLYFPGEHLGAASLQTRLTVFHQPIEVPKTTLDECLAEHQLTDAISFIKCDVEQHELAVFQGAQKVLKASKPLLLFESDNLASGMEHNQSLFDLLNSLGYHGYFFTGAELCRIEDFDREQHAVDRFAYQNYVFSHPERLVWTRHSRPFAIQRLEASMKSSRAA